jgi:hypothetical protein
MSELTEPHEKFTKEELGRDYAERIFKVDLESEGLDEVIRLRDEADAKGFGPQLQAALINYFETNILQLRANPHN